MDVHGFVTAGGRSSRMGQDKAWLEIDGRPMIERVVEQLLRVTPTVSVIANDPSYARLGLPLLKDVNSGIGPLEAIRVALGATTAPAALLLACDLPFVTAELLEFLLHRLENHQAAVPLSSAGRFEPLCAVYSREGLEPVTEIIASGERKVSRLFDLIRVRLIPFDELSHLSGAERFFININTPEDYARASEVWANKGPDRGTGRGRM